MKQYSINTERVTWEIADGEAVIVHFESSAYYALNPTGTYIWTMLAEKPDNAGTLSDRVAASYAKSPGEILADIEQFLENLEQEDLVTEQATPSSTKAPPPDPSGPNGGYQPPRLTRFGELEKLILSGE